MDLQEDSDTLNLTLSPKILVSGMMIKITAIDVSKVGGKYGTFLFSNRMQLHDFARVSKRESIALTFSSAAKKL